MGRYQKLAGSNIFFCSDCGRRKNVMYVPSSSRCRQCALKHRHRDSRELVNVSDDLVVTEKVRRGLAEQASQLLPSEPSEPPHPSERKIGIGEGIQTAVVLLYFPIAIGILHITGVGFSERGLLLLLNGVWGPLIIYIAIHRWLKEPRAVYAARIERYHERLTERIRKKTVELAQARAEQMHERQVFYASPEWKALRRQVIDEDGRTCKECGVYVKNTSEITMDHIQPRSRYSKLALNRDNLQVLCRSCNSSKGASEESDINRLLRRLTRL